MTIPMMPDPETPEERRRRALREEMARISGRAQSDATRVSTDPNWRPAPGPLDLLVGIGRSMAENPAETALSFTPGIGDAMSLRDAGVSSRDAVRAVMDGRYGAALGNTAMAGLGLLGAVPLVGVVGDVGKQVVKGARALGPGQSLTRATRSGGAIPNFRSMTPDDALAAAREGQHLRRVGQSDQYVGAPRGVESPKDLRALRENYDALVESGAEGGDWYQRSKLSSVEAAGYNPERQRLFAQEGGLWSSQANPDVNLGFLLRGHNAYELGSPLSQVRTRAQGMRYNAARDAGTDIPLGPKTGEFTNKFDVTSPTSHISTNDIWHFRNMGYRNPDGTPWSAGGTRQMHSFVDAESMLAADRANARALGGRTDWDAASTQAAPWVYAKGKALHEKYPRRFPTLQDGVDEANKTYRDYFPKYGASATFEAIPGAGTGHLEGIVGASPELRAAYSADPRSSWSLLTDEERAWRDLLPDYLRGAGDNRDILYDAAGMYVTPTKSATGYFRPGPDMPLETNPSFVSRPLVELEKAAEGSVVAPRDRATLDAVEALRSYLDAQNAGAWHKILPDGKAGPATSLRVPMNRALTETEVRSLADVVEPRGFGVVDTGQGVSLLNFGDGPQSGSDLLKLVRKGGLGEEIGRALPDATGPLERVRTNSGYVMQDENFRPLMRAENAGTGEATAALERYLTDPAIPDLLDKLDADPRLRQAALARFERDAEYAERIGAATRDDIQRARQIVGERGLKGLFDAARQGVALPILAVGVLGSAAARTNPTPAEGPTG